MSGLNMASKSADHMFALNLFLEWLSGFCGTSHYQEEISKIVRVIIAGKSTILSYLLGIHFDKLNYYIKTFKFIALQLNFDHQVSISIYVIIKK